LTKEIIVHNEHQKEIFMASHLVKRGVFEEIEDGENDLKLFTEIQSMLAQPKSQPGFGNPAAIGLGAFGATTILLQLHNLGIVGTGIVMWLAFIFGGLAQFIAGLQEFRTGNNFGSAAFVTYGAFWISLGGIFLSMQMGLFNITNTDVGWFLVIFTGLTFIYFIGSLKQNGAMAWVFLTLLIGFILLDIGHLVPNAAVFNKIAAVELIVCALIAWYLMAHVILTPLKIKVPAGKAWVS
jgi:succinate-acetate transporter protein